MPLVWGLGVGVYWLVFDATGGGGRQAISAMQTIIIALGTRTYCTKHSNLLNQMNLLNHHHRPRCHARALDGIVKSQLPLRSLRVDVGMQKSTRRDLRGIGLLTRGQLTCGGPQRGLRAQDAPTMEVGGWCLMVTGVPRSYETATPPRTTIGP